MGEYIRYEENGSICTFSKEIKELEEAVASLEQKLEKAIDVIKEFKAHIDEKVYLTDVEMGIIVENFFEELGE